MPVNYFKSQWKYIRQHFGDRPIPVAVEIGTDEGCWARGLLANVPMVQRLWCVDLRHTLVWKKAMHRWLNKRVFSIRGKSQEVVSDFHEPIDLLYVDGDHSYDAVFADLTLWGEKVVSGGLIIGHDYHRKSIRCARFEVFGESREIHRFGPGDRLKSFVVKVK